MIKMSWFMLCLIFGILAFCGCISLSQSSAKFQLALPIDCQLGKDCFIFHYVDVEPDEREIDVNCGRQTYNNHKGTDFGIANLKIMEKGVNVLAVAAGEVKRVRDGIIDKLVVNEEEILQVEGQECGNGIVIAHGLGWETQYCHLKQGSV